MTSYNGALMVTLHAARGLKNVNLIGKQSPYAKLSCGSESFQSKVHQSAGTAAEWNQAFMFNLNGVDPVFKIHVLDKGMLKDDNIGRIDITLAELSGAVNKWYGLVDCDNFKMMAGDISLSVDWKGTPALPGATTTPVAPAPTPTPTPPPQQVIVVQQQPQQVVIQQQPQQVMMQPQPMMMQPVPMVITSAPPMAAPGERELLQQLLSRAQDIDRQSQQALLLLRGLLSKATR